MNTYNVGPSTDTVMALRLLEHGVNAITIVPGHPKHPGCMSCQLETADGRLINVRSVEECLESRFEVFLVEATPGTARATGMRKTLHLPAPISVHLLETEEWLDPAVPTGDCIGSDPTMQCQGLPGSAPETASAVCRYAGAIELIGHGGGRIVIATASFPYTLHVQGFAEDERFDRAAYAAIEN